MSSNILLLNRRCVKHPEKGGAEKFTLEIAQGLVSVGSNVTWFSSQFRGAMTKEQIYGVSFVRKGSEITCHLHGLWLCRRQKWDLIVDEFNGIGFFTFPLKNSVLLIHQLYGEFWEAELGSIGKVLRPMERAILKLYAHKPTVTVSSSTAGDLERLGFKDVTIIYNGIDVTRTSPTPKESELTLVYLGRLKKTKNPEDAIMSFLKIKESFPRARLWLIGNGPLYPLLKARYGSIAGIEFFGYLPDEKRDQLLSRAHFLLVPSIREGWGQVVIQANAFGTPSIGYDVPGLRDSILNGKTGILVKNQMEMAKIVTGLWQGDKAYYRELCENARNWATNFSWEKTRKEFLEYLTSRGFLKDDP